MCVICKSTVNTNMRMFIFFSNSERKQEINNSKIKAILLPSAIKY